MFTFRGIPCIYYGSEVEFKKGVVIDGGDGHLPLESTGRAYFGDYLEGTVTASDFAKYSANGTVADTLESPLAKHLQKLNLIRREIPALQKGQYSTSGCKGSKFAFKRRYTDGDIDSYVLVTVSGGATFTKIDVVEYLRQHLDHRDVYYESVIEYVERLIQFEDLNKVNTKE